jgi:hypothetical protein
VDGKPAVFKTGWSFEKPSQPKSLPDVCETPPYKLLVRKLREPIKALMM